ncbi:MAG: family 43 glycosylhydrolase [Bacteroidales bacterium]|nr:family 43 glycosylhydrolase [Bacteroidales bacterium]
MKKTLTLIAITLCAISAQAQNPVIRGQYSADPTARVFDGKVYLYPSHDIRSEKNPRGLDWFCMEDYHVFSSDNLVDWRDHGVILKQEDVPWGNPEGYAMWAPDCVCKDGKYYFYFPDGAKGSRGGFNVGVAVADSPTGPFIPQEEPIKDVMGIDPCVLQCSNGDAYLIWSGMGLRGAKLKDNMLELEDGQTKEMERRPGMPADMKPFRVAGKALDENLPAGFKEGPFAFEKDGKFYLTYPWVREEDGTETLAYAMADEPLGPYEFKGIIMAESPTKCWTNHHSIVNYKGEWYLFYHHNDYSPSFDKNRSVRIDKLTFNEDGTIQEVTPTLRGVGLVKAERRIEADRYSTAENASVIFHDEVKPFDGWFIRYAFPKKKGTESKSTFEDVDFGFYAPSVMNVRLRSAKGGVLRLKVCKRTIGEVTVPKNSDWAEYSLPIEHQITGVKCLTFELVSGSVDLDWAAFSKFKAANPPEGTTSEYCVPGAFYPCVSKDGCATFSLYAPEAKEVAADICSTVFPMTKDAEGNWKVTTTPLPVGHHYYRLIVDGVKMNDPNVYTIYGCGSSFSQLEIPESKEAAAYYSFDPAVPHGQVRECKYWSESQGKMRRCFVYTPAEYETSGKSYPWFILQHGMAENETGWHEQGRMANIMDNNIASGAAVPMIVVMDNGDCDYGFGTIPGEGMDGFGTSFETVVTDELIPFIEKTFRVCTDRENRAIAGLSWGGHQAFEIGLKHTDLFSGIGAFSGAIFVFPGMPIGSLYNGVWTDAEKFNKEVPVLFMSNGTEENLGGMALDNMLTNAGINYTRYISEGTAHEWLTWRRSLNEFVKLIFKK